MVWKTVFSFFYFFYLNVVDAYLNQNSYVRFKYQTFMSNIKRENRCQVNVGAWRCPPNGQKTCMCVCVCVCVCLRQMASSRVTVVFLPSVVFIGMCVPVC